MPTKKRVAISAPARRRRRRSTPTAKRRTTRRRSRLAASPAAIRAAGMDTVMGAIGGAIAGFALESVGFIKNQNDTNKALIIGAVAVATGAFLKRPSVAAGMAGVAALKLLKGTNVLADRGRMSIPAISESMSPALLPAGLADVADYAQLSDIYPSYVQM